jgi:hypothetical protein
LAEIKYRLIYLAITVLTTTGGKMIGNKEGWKRGLTAVLKVARERGIVSDHFPTRKIGCLILLSRWRSLMLRWLGKIR